MTDTRTLQDLQEESNFIHDMRQLVMSKGKIRKAKTTLTISQPFAEKKIVVTCYPQERIWLADFFKARRKTNTHSDLRHRAYSRNR